MNESEIRERELVCPVCQQPFIDPYCAPCRHAFCRECIQTLLGGKCSCPSCNRTLKSNDFVPVPLFVKKMVDRLMVECIACGEKNIERVQFNRHLEETCPKSILSCTAADLRCKWQGRQKQLSLHLQTCDYERMRPILTEFVDENNTLQATIEAQQSKIDDFTASFELMRSK